MNDIIFSIGMTLEYVEKLVILKSYGHFRNNKTATASSLGISIRTLDNKLDKYKSDDAAYAERQAEDARKRNELLIRARGNPPNNIGIPYSPNLQASAPPQLQSPSNASRVHMESIANATAKPSVPLSERSEVQEVLPKLATSHGKNRAR